MKEEGKILKVWAQHSQLLSLWRGKAEGEPAEQALQHPALLPTEAHSGLTGSRGGENRPAGCRRTVNTCCKYL
ncbi:hypothetical protein EK904_012006 [Melospiza melodia maxima]|nr:hypothetical protein EK904_012006 [Melospiza melodia maxima]